MPLFVYSFHFYLPDQKLKQRPHQKTVELKYYDFYFIKNVMYNIYLVT